MFCVCYILLYSPLWCCQVCYGLAHRVCVFGVRSVSPPTFSFVLFDHAAVRRLCCSSVLPQNWSVCLFDVLMHFVLSHTSKHSNSDFIVVFVLFLFLQRFAVRCTFHQLGRCTRLWTAHKFLFRCHGCHASLRTKSIFCCLLRDFTLRCLCLFVLVFAFCWV